MAQKINIVKETADTSAKASEINHDAVDMFALSEEEYKKRLDAAKAKVKHEQQKKTIKNVVLYVVLTVLAVIYMIPVLVILINSFKSNGYVSDRPFAFPDSTTFVGIENFKRGLIEIDFAHVFLRSFIITIMSVVLIILCTSMIAWFITRVRNRFTEGLYLLFAFSMIVPFQMVMYTLSYVATKLGLNSPYTICIVYLGFGAGLSVFMFCGFCKSIPLEIEEAATVDGCNPLQMFFKVIFPILKPTAITVAILNAMWIWNDYLLPVLVLKKGCETIPIAIQKSLQGSYGSKDMGALMAMLVLTIIPIIIFYIAGQKYIIKGVVAGAVKG